MITLGSRRSRLALTQTELVAALLDRCARTGSRIVEMDTRGDRDLERPLAEIGGKGLFTAELEAALRESRIDAAVHSLKDLPVDEPDGLVVGAVPPRAPAGDVLVLRRDVHDGRQPLALPRGARVGTSSPRRRAALRAARPDLDVRDLRGNVPTRVGKVSGGALDAAVLARAGLDRLALGLEGLVTVALPVEEFTPAPGQGALGVQCRAGDAGVRGALSALHDDATAAAVAAERAVLRGLGGGCAMPLGVLAEPGRMVASLYGEQESEAARYTVLLYGDDAGGLAASAVARLRPLVGQPLRGRSLLLLRADKRGIPGTMLEDALAVAGARVEVAVVARTVEIEPPAPNWRAPHQAIAVTSARAAARLLDAARRAYVDLGDATLFAVGDASAAPLRAAGFGVSVPPEPGGGEVLAAWIAAREPRPGAVLFPCARDRHTGLEQGLRAAGIGVVPLPVYRVEAAEAELPERSYDAVIATSPTGAAPAARSVRAPLVALGSTTAAALADAGRAPVATAAAPDAGALVAILQEVLS